VWQYAERKEEKKSEDRETQAEKETKSGSAQEKEEIVRWHYLCVAAV